MREHTRMHVAELIVENGEISDDGNSPLPIEIPSDVASREFDFLVSFHNGTR